MLPLPVAVRYGWADNPDDLNLFNMEGLPTVPFRTDDWPGITVDKKYKIRTGRPRKYQAGFSSIL
jgi:hypothetical protein